MEIPLDLNSKQFTLYFRLVYQQFIDEMIIQPGHNSTDGERTDVTQEDHVIFVSLYGKQ